jgi:hypothetical protein
MDGSGESVAADVASARDEARFSRRVIATAKVAPETLREQEVHAAGIR